MQQNQQIRYLPEEFDKLKADFTEQWKERILLFHNGSMTMLLQTIHCEKVQIQILSEKDIQGIDLEQHYLYQWNKLFDQQNFVEREIILATSTQQLIYARSIWPHESYQKIMKNKDQPIGKQLIAQKKEEFRDILGVYKFNYLPQNLKKYNQNIQWKNNRIVCRCYTIQSSSSLIAYIEEYLI